MPKPQKYWAVSPILFCKMILSEDFYDIAGDILNQTQYNHTQPLYLAKNEGGQEKKCLEMSSMSYLIGGPRDSGQQRVNPELCFCHLI